MIDKILTLANDPATEPDLRREVARWIGMLHASAGRGDREQVGRAEKAILQDPRSAFTFDAAGHATLTAAGMIWRAGRFTTPSIAELRGQAQERTGGHARLWLLDGAGPATDIGSLQATACEGALFQVASQFNCLESPGPFIVPVADYFYDPTQGPRASISAFPGTLLRHYAAPTPGGDRFTQERGKQQIDLLADVFEPGKSPVLDGYLLNHGGLGPVGFVMALEKGFDRIRIGVHEDVQVVLGHNWDGAVEGLDRRITQVFTSTVAGGGYGAEQFLGKEFQAACRQTLRAAYLGTLLAAVTLKRTSAVLTLIGGGVFGNPLDAIWQAILFAFDEVRPLAAGPLDVVVNGHNLSRRMSLEQFLPDVRARGGAILRFGNEGLVQVLR